MQNSVPASQRCTLLFKHGVNKLAAISVAACSIGLTGHALGEDAANNTPASPANATSDPVLGLMLEKGMITEDEAAKVQAQVDARRTNMAAMYVQPPSKWKISSGIKGMELFGDLRVRYEGRSENDPSGGRINLERFRYSARVGLRGDVFDDFYYGLRLETSSNPRSTWVTMGTVSQTTTPGTAYSGPYGKGQSGINIGQIYLGWKPESWFDFTAGKMPNPLYTTPMVWSPSINPEGIAEHFKYTLGEADFFANFAQFLYGDQNPDYAGANLGINGLLGQSANNVFQVAWQGGVNYHIATNLSAKVAATVYQYYGLQQSTAQGGVSPYLGDPYVGEGAYTGPGSLNPYNGFSGYGTSGTLPGYLSFGYPNNQVGLDHLTVLEVPFEINYRFKHIDAQIFGDVAYNLDGRARAEAAAAGYAAYLNNQAQPATIKAFAPQVDDVKAYQFGLAVGSEDSLGMVYGTTCKKHAWEVRTYWQHVEQYALDPNLMDLDFFAGAENLEGIYLAIAYGFNDNFIGTFRYGHASRINPVLGTGGTGTDIPQINPINYFDLFQVDLTFKF